MYFLHVDFFVFDFIVDMRFQDHLASRFDSILKKLNISILIYVCESELIPIKNVFKYSNNFWKLK